MTGSADLLALGPMPAANGATLEEVERWEVLLDRVVPPVTDDEARALVGLLGPDEFFCLYFGVRSLIETAPGWPIWDVIHGNGPWDDDLRSRAFNSGFVPPAADRR